jgi:hypothetical protein
MAGVGIILVGVLISDGKTLPVAAPIPKYLDMKLKIYVGPREARLGRAVIRATRLFDIVFVD